jgi:PmbA protein
MDIAAYCIEAMQKAGIRKAQCTLRDQREDELNVDGGEISLLRTTHDTLVSLLGIMDDRKGTATINKTDRKSIDHAVEGLVELARSSRPDPANEIAGKQPAGVFSNGPLEPDLGLMYDRTREFLARTVVTYPTLILEQVILDFVTRKKVFLNSNGVQFESSQGYYSFSQMFTSREGSEASSFNYTGFSSLDLDRKLHEYASIDTLMRQSTEQVRPLDFTGKFQGDIIITPDCLNDFISFITGYLSDYSLISGTSIFKESLGREIADPRLTLRSMPVSQENADGYFFTADGFAAENSTVIEKGVLKTFLLSLYGSLKTGLPKAVNMGGAWMVDAGESSFEEMVRGVDRGILMCRFSGGDPSDNGDFSGVAKNSYGIEGGRVTHPIRETMISGNLANALRDIRGISRERVNFGSDVLPWVTLGGITISGK